MVHGNGTRSESQRLTIDFAGKKKNSAPPLASARGESAARRAMPTRPPACSGGAGAAWAVSRWHGTVGKREGVGRVAIVGLAADASIIFAFCSPCQAGISPGDIRLSFPIPPARVARAQAQWLRGKLYSSRS